jgi:hypothetical protein
MKNLLFMSLLFFSALTKNSCGDQTTVPPGSCGCEKNILADGSFTTVLTQGSDISNASPIWKPVYNSPQWVKNDGCCETGMALFWGHKTEGEAISQSVNIVQGKKYTVKICVRLRANSAQPYVRIRMFAYNGNYTYNAVSPAQVLIGQTQNITSATFQTVTLATSWTAPANFTNIAINPENDLSGGPENVSWADVDNLCMQEVPCDCGKWGSTVITGNGINKSVQCGQSVVVKKGKSYTVNPSYSCTCGGETKFSATLTSPSGQVQNINTFPYTFTPAELCSYKLSITPICGDKKCGSCSITLFSTPGCEGDIISVRRFDYDYLDIASYAFDKETFGTFLRFDVSGEEKLFDGVPAGSYSLSMTKTAVELINNGNNQRVATYPHLPHDPRLSCQVQEDAQWAQFNTQVAPLLIQRANATCSSVFYCLTILCNGQPTVSYLMVFKPASRLCNIRPNQVYSQAINIRDLK